MARGKTQRQYRSLYAKAKKLGLIRNAKDARSVNVSSYMRTKLNKLEPFLNNEYSSVKVTKNIAKAYAENPTPDTPKVVGNRVIVRNDKRAKAMVKKGAITFVRKLKRGEHERIILPFQASTVDEFMRKMKRYPALEATLKHEREDFAFRLYGHASWGTFVTLKDLFDFLEHYRSYAEYGEEFFSNIVLYRQFDNWRFDEERIKKRREGVQRKRAANKARFSKKHYEELKRRNRERVAKWRKQNPDAARRHIARQTQQRREDRGGKR